MFVLQHASESGPPAQGMVRQDLHRALRFLASPRGFVRMSVCEHGRALPQARRAWWQGIGRAKRQEDAAANKETYTIQCANTLSVSPVL